MMIEPVALLEIASAWVGSLEGLQLRIDAKVNRGAKAPESGCSRLHPLRAWVIEVGLSVGQAACEEKSNEWAPLPELLSNLELKGALVSIAARGRPRGGHQRTHNTWFSDLEAPARHPALHFVSRIGTNCPLSPLYPWKSASNA